jgi:hypothetical protein
MREIHGLPMLNDPFKSMQNIWENPLEEQSVQIKEFDLVPTPSEI